MLGLAFVWAGLSLGGNLIAAPAKFQVADLTMPVALQVGRAQFSWLGYAEWALLAALLVCIILIGQRITLLYLLPAGLFAAQQLVIMPLLNQRSDLIIAGSAPPEGSWHLAFILAEAAKFAVLLAISFTILHANLLAAANAE